MMKIWEMKDLGYTEEKIETEICLNGHRDAKCYVSERNLTTAIEDAYGAGVDDTVALFKKEGLLK